MKPVLTFDHVSKRYLRFDDRPSSFLDAVVHWRRRRARRTPHEFWVVRDFSLSLGPGEAVGIIGDNGAGKSTLLKLGAKIVEPTSGEVSLNGRAGSLLEVGVGFHPDLTGRENVYLNGSIVGLSRQEMKERFDEIVAFSEIESFIDMPVRHYSSGMLVRLGFAVATSVDPDILLIDEVLSVGDLAFRHKCLQRIATLQQRGAAILYVSHNLGEIRSVCDHVIWLRDAAMEMAGSPETVVREYTNFTLRSRGLEVSELGDEDERGRRLGTGDMEILDCVPLDLSGHEVQTVTAGGPVILRVRYRCLHDIASVVFGVGLYTTEGVRLTNADSETYHTLSAGEVGTAFLVFDSLPLKPGTYEMTVAASDPTAADYRPYVHHQRAYELCVVGEDLAQGALVGLQHRWVKSDDWEDVVRVSAGQGDA